MNKKLLGLVATLVILASCNGPKKEPRVEQRDEKQASMINMPMQDGSTKVSLFNEDVGAFEDMEELALTVEKERDTTVAKNEQPFDVAEANVEEKQVVYFDYDSSAVREDQKSRVAAIQKNIKKWLRKGMKVVFKGYACELGKAGDMYNVALSCNRAQALADYCGVPKENIQVFGVGRQEPVSHERTDVAQALNRRVEVYPVVT